MPFAKLPNQAQIYFEEHGSGHPLLLLAPGGLRSRIGLWHHTHEGKVRTWPDPIAELSKTYRVIAMDQRNAGQSRAPISGRDDWNTFAQDHLGLLDYLGVDRFHVMGGCIGCSFSLKLAELAPQRVTAAVLQQPIGLTATNAHLTSAAFDIWAADARKLYPGLDEQALRQFESNLYDGEFVYSVSRDFVSHCTVPLLVLAGNDAVHATATSQEIARLAPQGSYLEQWQGLDNHGIYLSTVREFLARNTP